MDMHIHHIHVLLIKILLIEFAASPYISQGRISLWCPPQKAIDNEGTCYD